MGDTVVGCVIAEEGSKYRKFKSPADRIFNSRALALKDIYLKNWNLEIGIDSY